MPALNKVILMGNLTRDPEVRYTAKGTAICDIGLAINRKYKVENEMREEVTFVDVTFWGKPAELISQHCTKGNPLYVEGRLQLDSWDDKQTGKKIYKLKVTGEEFQFLSSKEGGQSADRGFSKPPARDSKPDQPRGANRDHARTQPAATRDDEDEINF